MQKTIEDIKAMSIWMLWKKRARGTKVSKIPIAAGGGRYGTSEDYADRWVTYKEAQQAATQQRADGVGFRIPNGVFFLDIDHRDPEDPGQSDRGQRLQLHRHFRRHGGGL